MTLDIEGHHAGTEAVQSLNETVSITTLNNLNGPLNILLCQAMSYQP